MGRDLQFDPVGHRYTLDGVELYSVTQVLKAVLPQTDSPFWKSIDRTRGKIVHLITEAVDQNDWDPELMVLPDILEPQREKIVNRGNAYLRFVEETGFRCSKSEFRVASMGIQLSGTVDKLGFFSRGKYAGAHAIVDIKSGQPTAAAIPQVALYEYLTTEWCPDLDKPSVRVILWLRDTAEPRPEYRTGKEDIMDGLALVRCFHFCRRNGLIK